MTNRTQTIRLVQDMLRENVAMRPNKVALICENQRLTYSQIDTMSNRLANAFRQNGVRDGDRVLFYLLNSSELVVSMFAALKANAVFSAIDYANTFETLRGIAADCQAKALVADVYQAEPAARLLRELPSLQFVILTGQGAHPSAPNLLSFDAIQADSSSEMPPQRMIDRDLAYFVFTSGSTGKAKGVMTTHSSSLAVAVNGVEYFGLSEDDVLTSPLPLSHGAGLNQLLKLFRAGGTLILEKSFTYPAATLKRMAAEGATGFASMPSYLSLLLRMDLSRFDLSHLRYVSSTGAPLTPGIIQKFRQQLGGTALINLYGLVEAPYSMCLDPAQLDQRPGSVGKPLPGIQAWILDEDNRRLGTNETGELVLRGSHVRSGYWNDPATSAQRFRPGPLPGELVYHTGDIFRMDEEGYFYFIGRRDEMINSGAKKFAPKEIEDTLYRLTGVLEAAAIGVPDPILGQVVKAFVVLDERSGASLTAEVILRHCRQILEDFKVPRQIEIRNSLPKASGGKIKKADLA
jgi:long-chain acyl-CoA synthetase